MFTVLPRLARAPGARSKRNVFALDKITHTDCKTQMTQKLQEGMNNMTNTTRGRVSGNVGSLPMVGHLTSLPGRADWIETFLCGGEPPAPPPRYHKHVCPPVESGTSSARRFSFPFREGSRSPVCCLPRGGLCLPLSFFWSYPRGLGDVPSPHMRSL